MLFAVAVVATTIAGISTFLQLSKNDRESTLIKSRLLLREYRRAHHEIKELIEELGMEEVKGDERQKILPLFQQNKRRHHTRNRRYRISNVLSYQGHLYLYLHSKRVELLLKDKRGFWQKFSIPIFLFSGMLLFLLLMYLLLRRNLSPVKALQKDIVLYGKGALEQYRFSEKKDEISMVANAFYASAKNVRQLTESRQLFVRNIFHELNTPVTKGKILAELVDEPKTKEMLDSIFSRLAVLLQELAQMEKIISEKNELKTHPVRIIDLIDQASDLLYLDQPIPYEVGDVWIEADFATMSIVFKNLIDNALKYGEEAKIVYSDGEVRFISRGEKLEKPLRYYCEPFSAEDGNAEKNGFGLGLYIVHEILKKHQMKLLYRYENMQNIFIVKIGDSIHKNLS